MPGARGERRGQHQPADRRVAQAAVDRALEDVADRLDRARLAVRLEPDVAHEAQRHHQSHAQHRGADEVGHAEVRDLRDEAAGDRAAEHRRPRDRLGAAEDVIEVALEAGGMQRVDQPCLGRAGEEGEAQAQQDRGDRPAPQRRVDLPHHAVEERRDDQRRGARARTRAGGRGCRRRRRWGSRRRPSRP